VVRAVDPDPGDDDVLRAKYLDWCSAKVADRFLRLTPEEIYELAQGASRGEASASPRVANGSALPASAERDGASFSEIVEQVTAVLTAQLNLPPFDEWAREYARDPAQYDDELLGLWRDGLKK
jgi:hypothetical protein